MACAVDENVFYQILSENTSCMLHQYDPCSTHCFDNTIAWDFHTMWPEKWAYISYGKIYLVLVVIVTITTVLIALVLSKKHMRTPTNSVLLYIAIADFAASIVPFPVLFMFFTLGYCKNSKL